MATSQLRDWLAGSRDAFAWIEYEAYARRVFANAGDDWYADAPRYAGTLIQAQAVIPTRCVSVDILAPFVVDLPAGAVDAATIIDALAEPGPQRFTNDVINALLHRFAGKVDIILKLRSAADLLGAGHRGAVLEFDMLDDVCSALAGLLRAHSDKAINGLLVEKCNGDALSTDELDAYEPLVGAARHYGWVTALSYAGPVPTAEPSDGLAVDVILYPDASLDDLPTAAGQARVGGGLNAEFWRGERVYDKERALLHYGSIPADAEPEAVLSVLRALAR